MGFGIMKFKSIRCILAIIFCIFVSTFFINSIKIESNFDQKKDFGIEFTNIKTNLDGPKLDIFTSNAINEEYATHWDVKPIEDAYTEIMYHFDDNTGLTAEDTSVNEQNGTVSGADWTPGIFDSALDFEATDGDDFVGTLHDTAFNLAAEFTVEVWLKPESIGNKMCILGKGVGGDPNCHYIFVLNETGYFYLSYEYSAGNFANTVYSTTQAQVDTWYHVAVTFNSTSLNIYVNGTLLMGH